MYKKITILTTLLCLALDQLHKYYMLFEYKIQERGTIEVLPFFNLVMVWNKGISFGMGSGHDYSNYIFAAVNVVISIILLAWAFKTTIKIESYGIGFVLGGAIGNLIDRLNHGAVADFFDFHVNGWHWPSFNIADSTIFIGACILVISSIFSPQKPSQEIETN